MNPPAARSGMNHRPSILDAGALPVVRPAVRRANRSCPRVRTGYIRARDGIIEAIGPLTGRNRIVADFYDGPGWVRFRPWEQAFLMVQGGVRRARMEILRHVIEARKRDRSVLEVGIGSGENLAFLPPKWDVFGVDIARTQLKACLRRHPGDGKAPGLGRGRKPSFRRRDFRRLTGRSAGSTISATTRRPCAKCAA